MQQLQFIVLKYFLKFDLLLRSKSISHEFFPNWIRSVAFPFD